MTNVSSISKKGKMSPYIVLSHTLQEKDVTTLMSYKSPEPNLKTLCAPWKLLDERLYKNVHVGSYVYRRTHRSNWVQYLSTLPYDTIHLLSLLPTSDDQDVDGLRTVLTNYTKLEFKSPSFLTHCSFSRTIWKHKPAHVSDKEYTQELYLVYQFAKIWYQRPDAELLPLCGSDLPISFIVPQLVERGVIKKEPLGGLCTDYTFVHEIHGSMHITLTHYEGEPGSIVCTRYRDWVENVDEDAFPAINTSMASYENYVTTFNFVRNIIQSKDAAMEKSPLTFEEWAAYIS
jgi:hypothetical protein